MVRNDILQKFPDLFGAKKVNGRDVNVEEAITTLTRELRPAIADRTGFAGGYFRDTLGAFWQKCSMPAVHDRGQARP